MGQKINRIRINRLYSEHNVFDEICFHDGINLILGEKYDETTTRGRKTNGVGKSMSIEFLDFCLLSDYDKSRLAKIPEEVLSPEEFIILELEIGSEPVAIKRNRRDHEKPVIIRNGKETQFDKIQDARDYITELVFPNLAGTEVPSFRNLLSVVNRDERSEFSEILKCHDLTKRIPDDPTVHLFMFGMQLELYTQVMGTIKEIDTASKAKNSVKKELTQNGNRKVPDVRAEMNALNAELSRLEEAIDSFKSNEAFISLEDELVDLENTLETLRQRQKILKREYEKIKAMPQPEQVDDAEIELVYNQFKKNLGDAVVKSLNEVVGFKNKVEEFQKVLMNQKAQELKAQIAEISEQIRVLDEQYAEKIRIIDADGVLGNLKAGLRIYEAKKDESARTQLLLDQYTQYEKQHRQLKARKSQEIVEIANALDELADEKTSFENTLIAIHESIMGNSECSFEIKVKESGKTPIAIILRIYDDGSHSVDRTKVFIYDMALMFDEYTRTRHPLLLIHDNIFDVDQDTLVQCLNYVYTQEEHYPDFQYILTLNRDKIQNEERQRQIHMDIDAHTVATFTKEHKFLRRDYQEIS